MSRILGAVTGVAGRRPVVVIVATLVVTLALASRIPEGELVNDTSTFSPVTDEVLAAEELQARFDDAATATIQVVVEGPDVVSADGLRTVATIEDVARSTFGDALAADGGTVSFLTPAITAAQVQGVDVTALDDTSVDRLQRAALEGPPPGAAPPGDGTEAPARAGDLAVALVAGEDPLDAPTGLALVQLDRSAFADEAALVDAELAFAEQLADADTPLSATPFSFELISSPDDGFQREVGQLFGLAAAVILVVLAFVLRARRGPRLGRVAAVRRSVADMVTSIGAVVLAVVWVQGLTVVLGPAYLGLVGQASPPTQIIPVLLLALGVDYAIHLQSRYREELAAGGDPVAITRRLGPTVGVALLLSMVTTAVGFLTNLASPIPAIQDLGVLAAAGIVSAFVLSVTFLPAVRALLDRRPASRGELVVDEVAPREDALLARVALVGLRPALRAPAAMLSVALVLSGAGAWGLTQLETEFDFTAFLPDDSPQVAAARTLSEDFGGGLAEVTEVLVTGPVLDADVHNGTGLVDDRLDGSPGVVSLGDGPDVTTPVSVFATLTPTDPDQRAALDAATAAGLQPDGTLSSTADVAVVYRTLAEAFPAAATVVDPGVDGDGAVRIAVRTQSEDVGPPALVATITDALQPVADAGADVVVTSQAIISDDITTSLRDSQVQGLVITVVAVMLLLGLVYGVRSRQPGLGVLVMLPVVAVVLWTFGLMALTGIPFDPVTAVISALVVGLGVDFCIHLGERFVEDLRAADGEVAEALRSSLRHTGAALAGSAATTLLGFSVLSTASILPFQRLGIVTTYAVSLSLVATLFVLPPLLVLYGRWQGRRSAAGHVPGDPGVGRDATREDAPPVVVEVS